ncbi:hypothetical protein [Bacillus sp. XF8]|nr:hypothetical protein [Bacillus sp. XF8]MBO1580840.1 hypothetical protein [Bacillus sp. XF8]
MNRKKWMLFGLSLLFLVSFTLGLSNWDTLTKGCSDFKEGFTIGFFN